MNLLTAKLVDRLTAKLVLVNLVKLHLTKFIIIAITCRLWAFPYFFKTFSAVARDYARDAKTPTFICLYSWRRSRFSRFASLSLAWYPTIFASRKIREAGTQSQSMLMFFLDRAQHCTVHVILDYYNNIMRLIFSDYWTGLIEIQDRRKKGSLFLRICLMLKILRLVVTDQHSY